MHFKEARPLFEIADLGKGVKLIHFCLHLDKIKDEYAKWQY